MNAGPKPIYKQVIELRSMWQELWWAMADGKKTEYDKIKETPVLEFWKIYDLWKDARNREVETMKQHERKNK